MWGDPGVTELNQLLENPVVRPNISGGQKLVTMSRAGILRRLRFYMKDVLDTTVNSAAASKSAFGPLAGISNISVKANGNIDLVNLSGYGAAIYNEVQNRDGSVLSRPLNISELNISDSLKLAQYDTVGTTTGTFYAQMPFEVQFAIPMEIQGRRQEIGLWMLQNQAVDMTVNVTFNPLYAATANNNEQVWSGGTITGTMDSASQLEIERELYDVPADPKDYPRLDWGHQVIEYTQTFTGKFSRFDIPRSGLLLRAIVINLDSNEAPVEYSDISSLNWTYGANRTPISRKGEWFTHEYLMDYNRQPPKGVQVIDFYKWGEGGLKLVKDTDVLANLRLETTFAATTSGSQRIILDRLYPVATAGAR